MSKKSFFLFVVVLFIIPLQLLYLYLFKNQTDGEIYGIKTNSDTIINSLFIGDYRFTLFGYSSPKAMINLFGQGIADQTYADENGYFEFKNRFLPLSPNEACLTAKDQFGRISAPTCLPKFPIEKEIKIGPVIIPPTVSLDKSTYYIGDEIILTGQTIPNKDINLSLFTSQKNQQKKRLSLTKTVFVIKPVEAFSLPKLKIKSDDKGNFSISLPSSQAQNYRIFTQVNYEKDLSANSLTLSLKILPIWWIIIKFFSFIFYLIKERFIEFTIVLELIILIFYFLKKLFHPYYLITKKNAITLYENHLPQLKEKYPLTKY